MAPPSIRLTLAQTLTSRGMDLRGLRGDGRRAEQGIWMEDSIVHHKYGFQTTGQKGFHRELSYRKPHDQ